MKKQGIAACIAALLLFTSGCSVSEPSSVKDTVTEDTVLAQMDNEQKNWIGGLSKEHYREDLTFLYETLKQNYPYLSLAKRAVGADLEILYPKYLEQSAECNNDNEFYNLLKEFVSEFGFTGHLDLWGTRYFSQLDSMKELSNTDPQISEHLAPYIAALENETSRKTYEQMERFFTELEQKTAELLPESSDSEGDDASEPEEESANVETRILEEGKVAYLAINSFDPEMQQRDKQILFPFYEQVADYPHLIIDISQNPGGSMLYFDELVLQPLTKTKICVPTYQLFLNGTNNAEYLNTEEGFHSGRYRPISELPKLEKINREDLAGVDSFYREDFTIMPSGTGFSGKIWLLVSENNYSSSEYAAMISKQSGFATLVGSQTSGDGIGTDPVYAVLPNSGFVVQYSPFYGVTADGTGSEEFGTTPDILSSPNELPLDTCLKEIKKSEQKSN